MRYLLGIFIFTFTIASTFAYTPSKKDIKLVESLPPIIKSIHDSDYDRFNDILGRIEQVLPSLEGRNKYIIGELYKIMASYNVQEESFEEETTKEDKEVIEENSTSLDNKLTQEQKSTIIYMKKILDEIEALESENDSLDKSVRLYFYHKELLKLIKESIDDEVLNKEFEFTNHSIAFQEYKVGLQAYAIGKESGELKYLHEAKEIIDRIYKKNSRVQAETNIKEMKSELNTYYYEKTEFLRRKITSNNNEDSFYIPKGEYLLSAVYSGNSNFVVWLQDSKKKDIELVVNEIDGLNETFYFSIPEDGNYYFKIDAKSNSYTLKIKENL